jgi:hypothetical protein
MARTENMPTEAPHEVRRGIAAKEDDGGIAEIEKRLDNQEERLATLVTRLQDNLDGILRPTDDSNVVPGFVKSSNPSPLQSRLSALSERFECEIDRIGNILNRIDL